MSSLEIIFLLEVFKFHGKLIYNLSLNAKTSQAVSKKVKNK